MEAASEHPVSLAIVNKHPETSPQVQAGGFRAVVGRGAVGEIDGRKVEVGKPSWVGRRRRVPAEIAYARRSAETRGQTMVFVAADAHVCGAISVGDNAITAQAIADQAGIDEVIADVLPDGKVDARRTTDAAATAARSEPHRPPP